MKEIDHHIGATLKRLRSTVRTAQRVNHAQVRMLDFSRYGRTQFARQSLLDWEPINSRSAIAQINRDH